MHKGSLTGKDTEIAYGSIPSHMLRQFRGRDHRINVTGPGDSGPSGSISISAIFEPEQVFLGKSSSLLTYFDFRQLGNPCVASAPQGPYGACLTKRNPSSSMSQYLQWSKEHFAGGFEAGTYHSTAIQ